MNPMDRFDDVSVVTSVDESPPPPRMSRRARRAFMVAVASVVATAALGGAAVGLADEKSEPAPSAGAPAAESFPVFKRGGHECHRGEHLKRSSRSSSLRY
jgi:hypothetical protein